MVTRSPQIFLTYHDIMLRRVAAPDMLEFQLLMNVDQSVPVYGIE